MILPNLANLDNAQDPKMDIVASEPIFTPKITPDYKTMVRTF
jgi:hypothetical protein|tara:strand:- start:98 stop:223 length:126 start_codon:yes stop_codon:yes gene_type:complete